jgi:hypothetical protein
MVTSCVLADLGKYYARTTDYRAIRELTMALYRRFLESREPRGSPGSVLGKRGGITFKDKPHSGTGK